MLLYMQSTGFNWSNVNTNQTRLTVQLSTKRSTERDTHQQAAQTDWSQHLLALHTQETKSNSEGQRV